MDIIKSIILGIIEGITEWLPISSTGHLIIADEFMKLGMTDEFMEMLQRCYSAAAQYSPWWLFSGTKCGPLPPIKLRAITT